MAITRQESSFGKYQISVFTELALWADSVSKLRCPSVVCVSVSVCAIAENPLPGGLETSGQRVYRYYWHTSTQLSFFHIIIDKLCVAWAVLQIFMLFF